MSTINYQSTEHNNIINLAFAEQETEKLMSNLSSRKLWDILDSTTAANRRIAEAVKKELTRRNAFTHQQKFTEPH
ncbi:Uncharacterised protein [BD1-7 clade bacterium]|uniref:Uncharacterized protein n=1 Tax=BD1-7 clade bacterium TaxID=2029982 RepID=A0A5S9PQR1_9GAMM|nr:Uncharacterised protein [BD1-7 clade bacterium]